MRTDSERVIEIKKSFVNHGQTFEFPTFPAKTCLMLRPDCKAKGRDKKFVPIRASHMFCLTKLHFECAVFE